MTTIIYNYSCHIHLTRIVCIKQFFFAGNSLEGNLILRQLQLTNFNFNPHPRPATRDH